MDLFGRTCVVTGGSSGIGLHAAIALARYNARVILLCRDRERGEAARARVSAAGGGGAEIVLCDLASLAQVRRAAAEVRERTDAVYVLINNAGVVAGRREITVDGNERTFAVNHLAHFLLTRELRDLLRAREPSRVVTTTSIMHRRGRIPWDDLRYDRGYSQVQAYFDSKLANILFTRELARRLRDTRVTANCFHPGPVDTGLYRQSSWWLHWGAALARPLMIGAAEGADTAVYLATASEVAGESGEYFAKRRIRRLPPHATDEVAARRLWEISAKLCGVAP